jgi:hypothetical protein
MGTFAIVCRFSSRGLTNDDLGLGFTVDEEGGETEEQREEPETVKAVKAQSSLNDETTAGFVLGPWALNQFRKVPLSHAEESGDLNVEYRIKGSRPGSGGIFSLF